jgi:DNA-binding Lrp family transcriptional regulator
MLCNFMRRSRQPAYALRASCGPLPARKLARDKPAPSGSNAAMHDLDDLDRRLIAALREDARMPITRLAAVLKVSRTTAQARLDRLLESGTVLGFTIRARQASDQVRAVMMIEIEGRSTTAIIKRLRGFPELAALHTTNGGWDLVAEITAASLADFDRILREVRQIDGVLNSETSLLLTSL